MSTARSHYGLMVVVTWVLCLSTLVGCRGNSERAVTRIGITQIATHPGIDAIREGFLDEMRRNGYSEADGVVYQLSNAQGDMATSQAIAQKLAGDKCDLIFAISTPSSQAVAQAIKGTGIPLVFGAVTDPVAAGLVASLAHPGGNITGTSDSWPVPEQFRLLLTVAPNVRTVGLVYNPGETNAESNVKAVEEACSTLGLRVVTVPVSSTNEVQQAAQSLVGRCDALYVPADNTVIAAMDAVVRVSEENKLPLLPGVSSSVEQGGFGTLGPNYRDIGVESAKLAQEILRGQAPRNIPVATAKRFELFFNLRSARASGVNIPQSLIDRAAKVYR